MIKSNWMRLDKDGKINQKHIFLTNVIVTGTPAGSSVVIYQGLDAGTGDKFHTFTLKVAGTENFPFLSPVIFERGLFADLGSGITECTITWLEMDDITYAEYMFNVASS